MLLWRREELSPPENDADSARLRLLPPSETGGAGICCLKVPPLKNGISRYYLLGLCEHEVYFVGKIAELFIDNFFIIFMILRSFP